VLLSESLDIFSLSPPIVLVLLSRCVFAGYQ
jgi:hypothetical protein